MAKAPQISHLVLDNETSSELKVVLDKDAELFATETVSANAIIYSNDCTDVISRKPEDVIIMSPSIPFKLEEAFRPHQVDAARFMLSRLMSKKGTLLAHEMGLGKTLSCIGTIVSLFMIRTYKIVILCPCKLSNNWCDEFAKWQPMCQSQVPLIPVVDDSKLSGTHNLQQWQQSKTSVVLIIGCLSLGLKSFAIISAIRVVSNQI